MPTRSSYIHLSDIHFCAEPMRHNALMLIKRRPRDLIDTGRKHGIVFLSVAKPASYVRDIVSGVAQFCLERTHVADGIFITGDLATTGMMSDIRVAVAFVKEQAKSGFVTENLFPTLSPSRLPIFIVPGNHDKYRDNNASPNCKNFELNFDSYMRNCKSGVGHWIRRKKDRILGFISADFCLQDRRDALDKAVGSYGQGRVYEHVLHELKDRTFALRGKYNGIHLIWLIHFAPFDCGYRLRLIDFDGIIQSAISLGVVATLCGHTHKASKQQIDNHVVYCSGAAGCVDSEYDSRVHVIHIDVGEHCQISRESYIWDSGKHEFVFHGVD
jgi:3',5'-cyclic AMP phosphodiesterase CpdA